MSTQSYIKDGLINFFDSLPYYSIFLFIASYYYLVVILDRPFLLLWLSFGLLPLADMLIGDDMYNPSKEEKIRRKRSIFFRLPLYLYIMLNFAVLLQLTQLFQSTDSFLKRFYLFIIASIFQSNSVNVAHELCHHFSKIDRAFGFFALLTSWHLHYFIDHNSGHHKFIGTPEDAETAIEHQSVFSYLIESTFVSYKDAWRFENKRCRENNLMLFLNKMVIFTALYILYSILILFLLGLNSFIWITVLGSSAWLLLRASNYVEHYGLVRKKLADGSLEPISLFLSWNSSCRLSNYLLFKVERHSDHHQNSLKEYQNLDTMEDVSTLPHGYFTMASLAFVPPLFFWIMGDLVSYANKREKLPEDLRRRTFLRTCGYVIGLNFLLGVIILISS